MARAQGRRSFDFSKSKTMTPLILFTSLMLAATAAGLLWWSNVQNDAAARAEGAKLHVVIAQDLQALRKSVELAQRGGAADRLAGVDAVNPDQLFLVDRDNQDALDGGPDFAPPSGYAAFRAPLGGLLSPEHPAGARDGLRGTDGASLDAASLIGVEGEAFGAALIDANPHAAARAGATRLAVVGLKRLDPAWLARAAQRARLGSIEVDNGRSDDPMLTTLVLPTPVGATPVMLTWRPARPGDHALSQMCGLLLAFTTLFTALVVVHTRRVLDELAVSEARAHQLAGHDQLSGVANRLLFTQLMDAAIDGLVQEPVRRFALLYLDLDRFKEINDNFGHDAGDRMIVAVTHRIKGVLRDGDRLSRFGGDEFAILQTDIHDHRDAAALARRILDAVCEPFNLGEHNVTAGISIGIALAPHDATDRLELMRLADLALYRAKNMGRNRSVFYDKSMSDEARSRKTLEDELRSAISAEGLVLHYQPVMAPDGVDIVGVEALVRWNHPVRGMVPPDDFIHVAEDRGLIMPLGEWVLQRALADAARWPSLRIAVNVSPIQFRNREFVPSVARALAASGMAPGRLEIELTESTIIEDADQAEAAIFALRAMGVRIALDDFGTGYSSLIYLRRFAFDKIKIDRSFLQSMEGTGESAIIVHSIVDLGRSLGLTVTAEGIETPEQHRFLQALGCHEMQGFLFSKPVSAPEFDALLAAADDKKLADYRDRRAVA